MTDFSCPLCNLFSLQPVPDEENYFLCNNCFLIILHPDLIKDPESEKRRYLLHQNNPADQGYLKFLYKIIEPALPLLDSKMKGLDYGCGPSPVLSEILQNKGIYCENYDPFFFPIELKSKYEFIFSTECFEHFHNPAKEITCISDLLLPGGYLMIMTEWWQDLDHFKNWHYKRDFTHVCFYHFSTLQNLADIFGYKLIYHDQERAAILKKC